MKNLTENQVNYFAKAKLIYAKMKAVGTKGRSAWNEAQRQASVILKVIKKGVVTFWKLETGEITTREIEYRQDYNNGESTLFKFIDKVKNSVISFYAYQII